MEDSRLIRNRVGGQWVITSKYLYLDSSILALSNCGAHTSTHGVTKHQDSIETQIRFVTLSIASACTFTRCYAEKALSLVRFALNQRIHPRPSFSRDRAMLQDTLNCTFQGDHRLTATLVFPKV